MPSSDAFLYSEHTDSEYLEPLDTYFYRWENDKYRITFCLYNAWPESPAFLMSILSFNEKEPPEYVDIWECGGVWKKFKSTGRLEFTEIQQLFDDRRQKEREWNLEYERKQLDKAILVIFQGDVYISHFDPFYGFYILFHDDLSDHFPVAEIKYWAPIPEIPADA
jgi:hypothetical protein